MTMASVMVHTTSEPGSRDKFERRAKALDLEVTEYSWTMLRVTGDSEPVEKMVRYAHKNKWGVS